jgi:hypothetical protein
MTKIRNEDVIDILNNHHPTKFKAYENLNFDIVSDFEFRISNFRLRRLRRR